MIYKKSNPSVSSDSLGPNENTGEINENYKLLTRLEEQREEIESISRVFTEQIEQLTSPDLSNLDSFFQNVQGIDQEKWKGFADLAKGLLEKYDTWTTQYIDFENRIGLLEAVNEDRVHELFASNQTIKFPTVPNLAILIKAAKADLAGFQELIQVQRMDSLETQAHYFSREIISQQLVGKYPHLFDPMQAGQAEREVVNIAAHIYNLNHEDFSRQLAEFNFLNTPNDLYNSIQNVVVAILLQGQTPVFEFSFRQAQDPYNDFEYLRIPSLRISDSTNKKLLSLDFSDYFVPRLFDSERYEFENATIFDAYDKKSSEAKQHAKILAYNKLKQKQKEFYESKFVKPMLEQCFYNFHSTLYRNIESAIGDYPVEQRKSLMKKILRHIVSLNPSQTKFSAWALENKEPQSMSKEELKSTIGILSDMHFGLGKKEQKQPDAKQDGYHRTYDELNQKKYAITQLLVDSLNLMD